MRVRLAVRAYPLNQTPFPRGGFPRGKGTLTASSAILVETTKRSQRLGGWVLTFHAIRLDDYASASGIFTCQAAATVSSATTAPSKNTYWKPKRFQIKPPNSAPEIEKM